MKSTIHGAWRRSCSSLIRGLLPLSLLSCGPSSQLPANDAEALRAESASSLTTGHPCSVVRLSTEPDLVGWKPSARAKLASIADQGLAVVRYEQDGCDVSLTVLSDCITRKERYAYRPYAETQQRVVHNEQELMVAFPVAVATLRAGFAQGRGLRADYRLAGVQRIPVGAAFASSDLIGRCEQATHVVSAIYRGVFAVGSAANSALQADFSLLGAKHASNVEVLDRAGDPASCQPGPELMPGCDIPLRLELTPIRNAGAPGFGQAEEDEKILPAAAQVTDGRICPPRMAAIPPGTFFMGMARRGPGALQAHQVTLSPYCMDVNEVTVADYERCLQTGVCNAVDYGVYSGDRCLRPIADNMIRPRNCMRWRDAKRYCEWMGKRLPTEAEWEYAARGGSRNYRFPWGNEEPTPEITCWGRELDQKPCPIGQYPASSFGLKDMAGNLQEWVWDWFGPVPDRPAVDPVGPRPGEHRVAKGGSFAAKKVSNLRLGWRHGPGSYLQVVGFRCARDR